MGYMTPDERKLYEAQPDFQPPIESSVWQLKEGCWAFGSSMRCERLENSNAPEDAIKEWKDADGIAYCLRPQNPSLEKNECGPPEKPFNHRQWASVLFEIGKDILVKVKYSPLGKDSVEGDAMDLVRRCVPSVPVPECIHYWIDQKWDRSFLIMPRVHGVLLNEAWWGLSEQEKENICDNLAKYQDLIARNITSNVFQGVTGKAYRHRCFSAKNLCLGAWDHDLQDVPGPLTADELREQMSTISGGAPIMDLSPVFHLYHGDLSPTNVVLSVGEKPEDGGEREVTVAGIIDWEMAGFVPVWWITLYPCLSHGAYWLTLPAPEIDPDPDWNITWDYVLMLNDMMQDYGYESGLKHMDWYTEYEEAIIRQREQAFKEAKLAGRLTWLKKSH
ncbi:hypothetical protein MMC17_007814 [Xylographa soralifera]|nr:hypothetical protein [Xylographa soralifera]